MENIEPSEIERKLNKIRYKRNASFTLFLLYLPFVWAIHEIRVDDELLIGLGFGWFYAIVVTSITWGFSKCPKCNKKAKKIMSACTFKLAGGGWYADGYSSTAKGTKKDSGKVPKEKSNTE